MQNIDQFLEQRLAEISISEPEISSINKKIHDFFEIIMKYYTQIRGYAFGGSFDRYTAIPNFFDIDLYFIFRNGTFDPISGENMLNSFNNILSELETDDEDDNLTPYDIVMQWSRFYYHAIPIFLDGIKLDCVAAVEIPDQPHTYFIPNGNQIDKGRQIDTANPKLIEDRVQTLNKRTDGMGKKLIRLLKLWNYTHGKHLKSFQLELMVCWIFRNKGFDSLQKGIQTFIRKGLNQIQVRETSFSLWMLETKIDQEAVLQFREALDLCTNNKWNKLFPET